MLYVVVDKHRNRNTYKTKLVPSIGDEVDSGGTETITIKRRIISPSGQLVKELSERYGFTYNPNIDNWLDAFLYGE